MKGGGMEEPPMTTRLTAMMVMALVVGMIGRGGKGRRVQQGRVGWLLGWAVGRHDVDVMREERRFHDDGVFVRHWTAMGGTAASAGGTRVQWARSNVARTFCRQYSMIVCLCGPPRRDSRAQFRKYGRVWSMRATPSELSVTRLHCELRVCTSCTALPHRFDSSGFGSRIAFCAGRR